MFLSTLLVSHEISDFGSFLHVGCGSNSIESTPFAGMGWKEIRFDIDPSAAPDLIGTITNMVNVQDQSVDAIFSSHNIEHIYTHEVPLAFSEFKRVLKPSGFVLLTCPDLLSVCSVVADNKLVEPLYISPSGPITPIDILYGHRSSIEKGNLFMAHRCGFTENILVGTLQSAGFVNVVSIARPKAFDLWAFATVESWSEASLRSAAGRLFPIVSQ